VDVGGAGQASFGVGAAQGSLETPQQGGFGAPKRGFGAPQGGSGGAAQSGFGQGQSGFGQAQGGFGQGQGFGYGQGGFGQGADASGTLGEAPPGAGGFEAPSDHTKNQDTSGDLDLALALSASLNEDRGSKRTRDDGEAEEDSEDPNTKIGCG